MIRSALILVVLALLSCEKIKFDETTIQGKVINLTDNQPLAGYEVHLVETETPKEPFTPLIINTIATKVLSSDGSFSFSEELRKIDRYSYSVEFGTNGENFASNNWQRGNYQKVKTKVSINKGETNHLTLGQVPFGEIDLAFENLSSKKVEVKCFLRNHLYSSMSYIQNVQPNTIQPNSITDSFMAGEVELVWYIDDGLLVDSVIVPFVVEHNNVVSYTLTYSPSAQF